MKKLIRTETFKNIIRGAGSIMDIFGVSSRPPKKFRLKRPMSVMQALNKDAENIARDWQKATGGHTKQPDGKKPKKIIIVKSSK